MATPIEKLYSIRLGVQGENATTPIEIDMTSWLEEFPTARLHIMFKRYNDNYPYPVITEFDHPILRWIPTVTDTEYIGVGYAEILALDPETDLVKKSRVVPTAVENSVTGAYGQLPVPSPFENWVNQVLAAKDAVDEVASDIEGSAEAAEAAQAAAEAARDAAQAAAGDFQGLSATASGLATGAAPTVNVTHNEGGLYNLAFGIPKGDKGDQGDPAPAELVTPAVDDYLAEHFTNPGSPPLDRSLSSKLAAAPADIVGGLDHAIDDAYTVLGSSTTEEVDANVADIWSQGQIKSDGTINDTNQSYIKTSNYIDADITAVVVKTNEYAVSIAVYDTSDNGQWIGFLQNGVVRPEQKIRWVYEAETIPKDTHPEYRYKLTIGHGNEAVSTEEYRNIELKKNRTLWTFTGKVNKNQGAANAGKLLKINAGGEVEPGPDDPAADIDVLKQDMDSAYDALGESRVTDVDVNAAGIWSQGQINSNGVPVGSTTPERIKTADFISDEIMKISITAGYSISIAVYDSSDNDLFLGFLRQGVISETMVWATQPETLPRDTHPEYRYRVTIRHGDSDVSLEEYNVVSLFKKSTSWAFIEKTDFDLVQEGLSDFNLKQKSILSATLANIISGAERTAAVVGDELLNGTENVVSRHKAKYSDVVRIGFITDTHKGGQRTYTHDPSRNIAKFINACNAIACNLAIHGGDVITNYYDGTYMPDIAAAKAAIGENISDFARLDAPLLITKGNHELGVHTMSAVSDPASATYAENKYFQYDQETGAYYSVSSAAMFNEMVANGSTLYTDGMQYITNEEYYNAALTGLPAEAVSGEQYGGYYYYDILNKVRIVIVNGYYITDNGGAVSYGINADQIAFIQSAFSGALNEGLSIMTISHTAAAANEIRSIIQEFIAGGGNYIAHIHGHEHKDIYTNSDGFMNIGCNWGTTEADNTASEKGFSFDIFEIDLNNHTLRQIRTGYWKDGKQRTEDCIYRTDAQKLVN